MITALTKYRDQIKENLGYENYHLQDLIWWNRKVRLKTLGDLYRCRNFVRTFEDLVIEFDISIKDRRKYSFLMNGISMDWFYDTRAVEENLFDKIVASLFENGKITRFSYNIFRVKDSPVQKSFGVMLWMWMMMLIGVSFMIIILIVLSKHSWEHFISRFSIKQFAPINFLLKLAEVILLFVISVKKKIDETLAHMFCECLFHSKQNGG